MKEGDGENLLQKASITEEQVGDASIHSGAGLQGSAAHPPLPTARPASGMALVVATYSS